MQQAAVAVESKLVCGKCKQVLAQLVRRDQDSQVDTGDVCIACGDEVKGGALRRCAWDGADMHLACGEKCGKCSELFCSGPCKEAHICDG